MGMGVFKLYQETTGYYFECKTVKTSIITQNKFQQLSQSVQYVENHFR